MTSEMEKLRRHCSPGGRAPRMQRAAVPMSTTSKTARTCDHAELQISIQQPIGQHSADAHKTEAATWRSARSGGASGGAEAGLRQSSKQQACRPCTLHLQRLAVTRWNDGAPTRLPGNQPVRCHPLAAYRLLQADLNALGMLGSRSDRPEAPVRHGRLMRHAAGAQQHSASGPPQPALRLADPRSQLASSLSSKETYLQAAGAFAAAVSVHHAA